MPTLKQSPDEKLEQLVRLTIAQTDQRPTRNVVQSAKDAIVAHEELRRAVKEGR